MIKPQRKTVKVQEPPEHMEEDEQTPNAIPPWVELEYMVSPQVLNFTSALKMILQQMRSLAGQQSQVHFTHLSNSSRTSLSSAFAKSNDDSLAEAFCHNIGVLDLIKQSRGDMSLEKVCLLDPKAELQLSPEDSAKFEWFLFGVSAITHSDLLCDPTSMIIKGILG